jgi:hypothetical protein
VPPNDNNSISIKIYDLNGRLTEEVLEGSFNPGAHKYIWNAYDYSSGIYFAEFNAQGIRQIKKITILK